MTKQNNTNKGFSLVELIIAVAILALVISPILHAFVTSARIDGKSKRMLRATTAAQNIMEEIRGMDMNDVAAAATSGTALYASGPSVVSTAGSYVLTYDDEEVAGVQYDIIATVSAKAYSDEISGSAVSGGSVRDYNSMAQPEVFAIDRKYDGIYVSDDDLDDVADSLKKSDLTNLGTKSETEIKAGMKKHTEINILNEKEARISVTYSYGTASLQKAKNVNMTDGSTKIRALYLFFTPMSTSKNTSNTGADIKEYITVTNQSDTTTGPLMQTTVYLIGQEGAEKVVSGDSVSANYGIGVAVKEPKRQSSVTDPMGNGRPLTTIRSNLYRSADITAADDPDKHIMLSYETQDSGGVPQVNWTATTADNKQKVREAVGLNTLTGGKVEDKLYKVEVVVYDKDRNEELANIDGTKEK